MRIDIPLYIIAVVCFILAAYVQLAIPEQFSCVITLAVLGVIFLGAGYSMRPKPIIIKTKEQPQVPTAETEKISITPSIEKETVVIKPEEKVSIELTDVKGIGPKRAEQLKRIGVFGVEDLLNKSSEELAREAKVSTKTAEKWIEEARKLLEES